jgi:hypothetical protein
MFSSTNQAKDICHVGSALFMGNNIKLMCSNQMDTLSQTIWSEMRDTKLSYREGKPPKNHVVQTYYSYYSENDNPYNLVPGPDQGGNVHGYKIIDPVNPWKKDEKTGEEYGRDWIWVNLSDAYSNISKILESKSEDGSKITGLRVKFNDFKANNWMCGETLSGEKSDVSLDENNGDLRANIETFDDVDVE